MSRSWTAGCPHVLAQISNGEPDQEGGLTYFFSSNDIVEH